MVKGCVHLMHITRYLGSVLTPSSHYGILNETTLSGEAGCENDLSIAAMGSTNSKFDQHGLLLKVQRHKW
jgi:hypothetical protein